MDSWSAFSEYFLSHFVNNLVIWVTSLPEAGVRWERRHDDRADWRDQDSRNCTCSQAPIVSVKEEAWPPAEGKGNRELVGHLRAVVKVWSCYYGEWEGRR